jgi:hypothetical protein
VSSPCLVPPVAGPSVTEDVPGVVWGALVGPSLLFVPAAVHQPSVWIRSLITGRGRGCATSLGFLLALMVVEISVIFCPAQFRS